MWKNTLKTMLINAVFCPQEQFFDMWITIVPVLKNRGNTSCTVYRQKKKILCGSSCHSAVSAFGTKRMQTCLRLPSPSDSVRMLRQSLSVW